MLALRKPTAATTADDENAQATKHIVQRMRLLGTAGYRPVKAVDAEQANSPGGDGSEDRNLGRRFCETKQDLVPKPPS